VVPDDPSEYPRATTPSGPRRVLRAFVFPPREREPLVLGAHRSEAVQPILSALPVMTVSAIFCVWNAYRHEVRRRQRQLRERVAYMLWVAAERAA
jgi:hypothetical protein